MAIKIRTIDKKGKPGKRDQILEDYFRIIHPDSFLTWQNFLFDDVPLSEKKNRYKYLEADISKLKNLFKKRTIELNKMAHKQGYSNYFEAHITWNKIPKKKYQIFLKEINKFVSLVHGDIPSTVLVKKEKTGIYLTLHIHLDFEYHQINLKFQTRFWVLCQNTIIEYQNTRKKSTLNLKVSAFILVPIMTKTRPLLKYN